MSDSYRYPAELYLGLSDEPLYGKAENEREEIFLFLLNGFDSLGALNERRTVALRDRANWRYGEGRRFATEEDVARFIEAIRDRFRDLNERCLALSPEALFPDPEDAAASYLLRDAMMLVLPEEDAARVVREREEIFREFKAMRQSPTLKAITGKFIYRAMIKRYRRGMPR